MARTPQRVTAHNENDPITVDVVEACRISGLGETSLRQLIRDGQIECRYFNSKRLIVHASLKAYLLGLPEDRAA